MNTHLHPTRALGLRCTALATALACSSAAQTQTQTQTQSITPASNPETVTITGKTNQGDMRPGALRDDINPRHTHKIAQLSVAPLIAEAILRVQTGTSLQGLRAETAT